MLDFLTLQTTSQNPTAITIVYTVLLSFVLATSIAVTYEKTFRGLSYSRNFLQALVLGAIVAGIIMQAIGDSLARGLGMLGALAIIRFRTNFKDPRDIIFMFAALAVGIASGVYAFTIAAIGTLGFCAAAFVLHYLPIGFTTYYDGMLRFNIENTIEDKSLLEEILLDHCKLFALITLRDVSQGKRLDYAYHVKLKKNKRSEDLIHELNSISSIKGVNLLLQETTVEL
ncbi:MAG: DUF4956 domain-containing protein [bacterium]|nr:DUF4956 domain-containing protein [bacterium]